jgi:putative transposase
VVFFERDNYLYFLRGIKKYLCASMDIIAYCLMPTHYHILARMRSLQTSDVLKTSEVSPGFFPGAEVSKAVSLAMQRFGISYTKAINKRFDRVGALFQGQFHGKPVQQQSHLLNLCIYIHANPVKDNLVALPENWEFSNYPEWLNLRAGTLVNHEFNEENFGTPAEYQQLVMAYIQNRILPKEVVKYLQDLGA